MTVKEEEGKWTIGTSLGEAKPRMLRRCRGAESLEVESDMWYEILSRLPTKSLAVSKCVCKAWRDFASHILVQHRKMPFLPPRGVFFELRRFSSDTFDPLKDTFDRYIIYVSLTTKEISLRIDSPDDNTVNCGYNEQLLGNLTLDVNPFYANPSLTVTDGVLYFGHNGLMLSVGTDGTYRVFNPATRQVLDLPRPFNEASLPYVVGGRWVYNNAIINLTCPLSSTACCFFVMRFLKPCKLVEIYCSKRQTWVRRGFSVADRLAKARWYLANYVFLHGTLFVVTNGGEVVALELGNLDAGPKICSSYAFGLPEVLVHDGMYILARLGESQGCLYLSYADMSEVGRGLWIWKHDGVSSANPWIPLFEVSKTTRLCKPVAEEHLLKFYDDGHYMFFMCFHPEAAVVFIYVMPCLVFAYDLTNDTVDKIGVLDKGERLLVEFAHPYSPCLASLGTFMR